MAYFRTGANDYSSLQYNNLTAGNVKKDVTVTVKDANNQTLKSVTGTYTTNTFTNLTAGNIKNGVTVTVKDTDNTTLKSVTGNYVAPSKSFSCSTVKKNDGEILTWHEMTISNIQNVSSITIYTSSSFYQGNGYIQKNGTTVKTITSSDMQCTYTVTGLTNGSTVKVKTITTYNSYANDVVQISSFS